MDCPVVAVWGGVVGIVADLRVRHAAGRVRGRTFQCDMVPVRRVIAPKSALVRRLGASPQKNQPSYVCHASPVLLTVCCGGQHGVELARAARVKTTELWN